ncbi:hypothetical protein [Tenacibaculum aquimarinum]|uniref:hypothetical protein n=1 Tax=Tenacibaculum aquimarinum TaxID=2910675 RepID=UPI001F0A2281|nr:hypothetical protein [Tenacibaculum aquimarinum]MCH3884995.1 hypothetical protein [Tenacibaculum aquimarinum]
MKSIFITTSPQITTLTTFYIELAKTFQERGYRVVVIFDSNKQREEKETNLIYKVWPNKRPTKIKDFLFFKDLIELYKPQYIISSFGAVNISLIAGYIYGVKNRIAWIHTNANQIIIDSNRNQLKAFVLKQRKK